MNVLLFKMSRKISESRLWVIAGISVIASMTSVLAAEPAPIDFKLVNPVLQAITDAVILNDEMVDFANPKFDEKFSDMKAEKLKFDLVGSMKDTPWLDGGKASVRGTSSYWAERGARTGIGASLETQVDTDVLALVRYSAYIALRKSAGYSPKFESRIIGHLKRLYVVTSLDEVYVLLTSAQKLMDEIQTDRIESDRKYLKCIQEGQCAYKGVPIEEQVKQQQEYIDAGIRFRDAFNKTKIEAIKENGHVKRIELSTEDGSGFGNGRRKLDVSPGKVHGYLTETSVGGKADGFVELSLERLNSVKATYETRLRGHHEGNPEARADTQENFRNALIAFKQVLRGENRY